MQRIVAKFILALTIAVTSASSITASAQLGDLDQFSPYTDAWFNLDASILTWQQQVRAGVDGQLEGVALHLTGITGQSELELTIGVGDAWSNNLVFTTNVILEEISAWHYIEMTDANIQLKAGDTFVIQTKGNDTGMELHGSWVELPGQPEYPEPLYLNNQNYADGQWRHALKTYMLNDANDCVALKVDPLVAGKNIKWEIAGADPHAQGVIVYGTKPGSTQVNGYANYCADFGIQGINQNRIVGFWTADASGDATITKTIPAKYIGQRILTQAAQRGTCPDPCTSNIDDQVVG